ncbi:MAG: 3-deoxy-8-phosphooctulonate synthase, partial [Candidatus Omnitrophica bacterium]|nr:3-deoxy-8-phosphooctulonate synthase [Candidatus Omnitrophota bacterium]
GIEKGLNILLEIKKKLGLRVLSDVHTPEQVNRAKEILDVIQIPAFLCRQTDIILEAAKTKKTVNIKKGQFLAPEDIRFIIEKVESTGNRNIFITERGTCFGYNNLVVDFRSFLIMRKFGYPVIFDVTHSLQKPSAAGGVSGGDREYAKGLALAAVACGVDGLFMEVHPEPKKSLSDKNTVFELKKLNILLKKIIELKQAVES